MSETDLVLPPHVSVSLKNVTARWVQPDERNPLQTGTKELHKDDAHNDVEITLKSPTLDALDAEFEQGKLIGIIGPVGAGKSSFFQALLRELPVESGVININGTMSYASQEPWVFAGTVRQNILFGMEYEKERYDAVIKACALVRDFEQLSDGDRTLIGERGTSLSGGQKARVKYVDFCRIFIFILCIHDRFNLFPLQFGESNVSACGHLFVR